MAVPGDGAYLDTGLIVPHRKRHEQPLLKGDEEDSAAAPQDRRGRPQRGDGLHHAVQAEVERTIGRYAATEECPVATAELPGRSSVDDLLGV
ncbi:hypothetical protein PV963_41325 [Streptomyces coeruleorubidus]|nr:hypothetical protein [Streptomyces coeruleorubidus]WDV56330.1 hypothetical protein PV963_41325 [Streptomyces coeruleorubidus]